MKIVFEIIILLFIFCTNTVSQNTSKYFRSESQDLNPKATTLKTQFDSLNYTLGLTNGDGIKKNYLKTDTSDKPIIALMNAINEAYNKIVKGEMYRLGVETGHSFKQQKSLGLMGVSTIVFNEEWVKKGMNDALYGSYTLMKPKEAEQFIQESMVKLKNGSLAVEDEIINRKLNYAFGMANGEGIKNYYIKGDSANIKITSYLSGIKEGIKEGIKDDVKNEYSELLELGIKIGNSLKEQKNSGLMGDSTLKLNFDLLKQGLINGLRGSKIKMTPEDAQIYLQQTMQARQSKKMYGQYGNNKIAGERFLTENAKKTGVITTASGLQYEVIEKGYGRLPFENNKVKVNYHGTLLDGTVFDSSVDRKEPVVFIVNQVIKGWTEALQLMSVGSKYKLYIPQELAYGAADRGNIKPFSMLIFEIELISIEE